MKEIVIVVLHFKLSSFFTRFSNDQTNPGDDNKLNLGGIGLAAKEPMIEWLERTDGKWEKAKICG